MLKNSINIILKVVLVIVIYLLQIYVFNNMGLFGVTGNLVLAFVIVTVMTNNMLNSCIIAGVCGAVSDILFCDTVAKYLVIYLLTAVILESLKRVYKQDTKSSVIVYVVLGVLVSEILIGIFNLFNTGVFINLFAYLKIVIKQIMIDICLAFLIYIIISKIDKGVER